MKALFLLGLLLFCCPFAEAATFSIPAPGRDAAVVMVPDQPVRGPLPMILVLHGYSTSWDFVRWYFGLESEVSRRGLVLVLPNGRKDIFWQRYWNATDACCDLLHQGGDDVGYLTSLVKEVSAKAPVDPRRIYVVGHSNGAFMAQRLACDTQGIFAAYASFAGTTYLSPADCRSTEPVSMLHIHSVDDPTIKYQGGRSFGTMKAHPSVPESVEFWKKRNLCSNEANPTLSADLTKEIPGKDSTLESWESCAPGAQVGLWRIEAHEGAGKFAHFPYLTREFTNGLLKFLLSHRRN
jgi:polyhydroxybutyrate depolymerase